MRPTIQNHMTKRVDGKTAQPENIFPLTVAPESAKSIGSWGMVDLHVYYE